MTVTVRMTRDVHPKARMDGRSWPFPGGEIELDEAEAADIMAADWAVLADEEEVDRGYGVLREADPDWDKPGDEDEEDDEDFEEPDGGDLPEVDDDDFDRDDLPEDDDDFDREPVTTAVPKPKTTDNKAAWIDWAVYNGEDEDSAASLTKADLIAKYGKV